MSNSILLEMSNKNAIIFYQKNMAVYKHTHTHTHIYIYIYITFHIFIFLHLHIYINIKLYGYMGRELIYYDC